MTHFSKPNDYAFHTFRFRRRELASLSQILSGYLFWILIVSQSDELGVSQDAALRPFGEFYFGHCFWP
jgi:hypothetical protein